MYGLVNRAVKDLVISSADEATWLRISTEAGLDQNDFVAMSTYDDEITYRLVAAASKVLGADPADILEGFGRHWILFTGAEGWGPIMDGHGSGTVEFLQNLNQLHDRVTLTMPSAVMPKFNCEPTGDGSYRIEYISEREGLAPMVLGLLRGLAEKFDEDWVFEHVGTREQDGHDTFAMTVAVAASAGTPAVGATH